MRNRRQLVRSGLAMIGVAVWCGLLPAVAFAQLDPARVGQVIRDLAAGGQAAGILVKLRGPLSPDRTSFYALLDKTPPQPPRPLPQGATARSVLARHFGGRLVAEVNGGAVLVDPAAALCSRFVEQPVKVARDAGMFPTIVGAFNEMSGQSVPDGSAGSCMGMPLAFLNREQRARTAPGTTLKQVLTDAVRREPGAVWLVVEARDGTCTLGLVLQAARSGTCRVQIGEPVRVVR